MKKGELFHYKTVRQQQAEMALRLAEGSDWPELDVIPWFTVRQGEDRWRDFVRSAHVELLMMAIALLGTESRIVRLSPGED